MARPFTRQEVSILEAIRRSTRPDVLVWNETYRTHLPERVEGTPDGVSLREPIRRLVRAGILSDENQGRLLENLARYVPARQYELNIQYTIAHSFYGGEGVDRGAGYGAVLMPTGYSELYFMLERYVPGNGLNRFARQGYYAEVSLLERILKEIAVIAQASNRDATIAKAALLRMLEFTRRFNESMRAEFTAIAGEFRGAISVERQKRELNELLRNDFERREIRRIPLAEVHARLNALPADPFAGPIRRFTDSRQMFMGQFNEFVWQELFGTSSTERTPRFVQLMNAFLEVYQLNHAFLVPESIGILPVTMSLLKGESPAMPRYERLRDIVSNFQLSRAAYFFMSSQEAREWAESPARNCEILTE